MIVFDVMYFSKVSTTEESEGDESQCRSPAKVWIDLRIICV